MSNSACSWTKWGRNRVAYPLPYKWAPYCNINCLCLFFLGWLRPFLGWFQLSLCLFFSICFISGFTKYILDSYKIQNWIGPGIILGLEKPTQSQPQLFLSLIFEAHYYFFSLFLFCVCVRFRPEWNLCIFVFNLIAPISEASIGKNRNFDNIEEEEVLSKGPIRNGNGCCCSTHLFLSKPNPLLIR